MLVEIWTLQAILVRSQMEMRNMLLDNGEKVILVIVQQSTWMNSVHILVFCRRYNSQKMKFGGGDF